MWVFYYDVANNPQTFTFGTTALISVLTVGGAGIIYLLTCLKGS